MAKTKVKKCVYMEKGRGDSGGISTKTNFLVDGNTESAVKEYLQKIKPNKQINIKEIIWD